MGYKNRNFITIAITVLIMVTLIINPMAVSAQTTVSQNAVSENSVSQNSGNGKEICQEYIAPESCNVEQEQDAAPEDVCEVTVEPLAQQVSSNDTGSSQEPETKKPDKVSGVAVKSKTYKSMYISYKPVYGAAGYEIYRGTSKKKMSKIADLKAVRTSYTDKGKSGLKTGTKYYYKVRAYVYDAKKQKVYGKFSKTVSGKPTLVTPVISKVQAVNYKTVKITYGKISGAAGYVIYRSTKKNSGYKKIGTVKKGKTVTYTDKKCKTGIKYYYKVRAYRTVSGKKKYSAYSKPISAKTKLSAPKIVSAQVANATTALVTWKKVSGASGYQVYRSETKKGKYTRVASVEGGNTLQTYIAGQENGKTFYYKVRAYRTVDKKKKYSGYSGTKKATFNLLASANETYTQRAQRIFGLDYYRKYSSKAEAELHMVTITVPVWDFATDGVTKVPKQRSLTVHKNIAETAKQIFQEIYEGEERFPIKNVGGYSWRGEASTSEHCCGLAIDINWEENYLIDNGVIISGKLYQPGVNPYSIPTDGEVARIMNKYGFTQGIWGNRCDYMHFSYFGT
ncbi:MAG: M15 family metallopeptidase [Lachnospiraceae bacterium]|nr:M15 family metallopeptidase [Lachnospiraceae bacterium]